MHASANTPAGAASASIALFPAATGLPLFRAGSTPTLPVSGPARRSLTFRPACSLNRLSRSFCQSASIHVVTSMNRPDCYQPETIVAGRDSHPLERGAFHGARGSRASDRMPAIGRRESVVPVRYSGGLCRPAGREPHRFRPYRTGSGLDCLRGVTVFLRYPHLLFCRLMRGRSRSQVDRHFQRFFLCLVINPTGNQGVRGQPVNQIEPAKNPLDISVVGN